MPLEGTCNFCGTTVHPIHDEDEHIYFIVCPLWRHENDNRCPEDDPKALVDIDNVTYDRDPEDLPLEER